MADEKQKYSISEEEKFIKIHINKNKGFDFDFDIFIPKNLKESEIEKNLLVSFKEEGPREEYMAETLQSPMMTINIATEDKKLDVSKYAQLEPSSLIDENGKQVAYPYGESGLNMGEQYANAIKYAYSCMKKERFMSPEHHERVDIEGYSYNAVIAQRFALLHPEMVRAAIYGGAISSIPIPLTEYNGEILNYPSGIADIQKYTGKSPEQILEAYKDIVQIAYATENELRYDGNFTIDGRRIKREDMPQDFSTTFSSHDVSPDIASVAFQQMRIFGKNGTLQTDINERVNSVKELILAIGVNLRPIKIYGNMDHHSTNLKTISDMKFLIESLDRIEADESEKLIEKQGGLFREHSDEIQGFEPETRNGKAVEIDTSFQIKREEIYERLRNGEVAEDILQSMSLQEIQKYFLGGAVQKPFIKTVSPSLIKMIEEQKIGEKGSEFYDQKSEGAFMVIETGVHTITSQDIKRVAKKDEVVAEKENAIQIRLKEEKNREDVLEQDDPTI